MRSNINQRDPRHLRCEARPLRQPALPAGEDRVAQEQLVGQSEIGDLGDRHLARVGHAPDADALEADRGPDAEGAGIAANARAQGRGMALPPDLAAVSQFTS